MKIKFLAIFILSCALTILNAQQAFDESEPTLTGNCWANTHNQKFISFSDEGYDDKDIFKFVIYQKYLTEIETEITTEQLIDLQRQYVVANHFYQEVLNLTAPLEKQRYSNTNYIMVSMMPIKANGVAWDEVTYNESYGKSDCHIGTGIKPSVDATTHFAPAHELFHLYQNSYFNFKRAWLYEGTARWAEFLFRKGISKNMGEHKPLPNSREELTKMLQLRYASSAMWTRLFKLVDNQSSFNIPSSLMGKTYLNGELIFKDNEAYGTTFIKVLFEELETQSLQASKDNNWDRYNWKEKDQKSPSNDKYIWQSIQNAVNKFVPEDKQSVELKEFLSIQL